MRDSAAYKKSSTTPTPSRHLRGTQDVVLDTFLPLCPRQTVRVLTHENSYSLEASTPVTAAERRRPFAVYLANVDGKFELLVFDMDDHDGTKSAILEDELLLLQMLLDSHNIPYAVTRSGGGSGAHVWVHCEPLEPSVVRELATALKRTVPETLDVSPLLNSTTGACRPPGATHRDGGTISLPVGRDPVSTLAPLATPVPADVITEFAHELRVTDAHDRPATETGAEVGASETHPHAPCDLPEIPRLRLQAEAALTQPPVKDRSKTAYWLAIEHVHAGFSLEEFRRIASDRRNIAFAHVHTTAPKNGCSVPRTRAQERHIIEYVWKAATNKVVNPRWLSPDSIKALSPAVEAAIDRAETAALTSTAFAGEQGFRNRLALLAIAQHARTHRRATFSMSCRQLASEASLSRESASQAFKALARGGWIHQRRRGAVDFASVWELPSPAAKTSDTPREHRPMNNPPPPGGAKQILASSHLDVWSTLPLSAFGVWHFLRQYPSLRLAELVRVTGLTDTTVSQRLADLEALGLVRNAGGDNWRACEVPSELRTTYDWENRRDEYLEESVRHSQRWAEYEWRRRRKGEEISSFVRDIRRFEIEDPYRIPPDTEGERALASTFPYERVWMPVDHAAKLVRLWRRERAIARHDTELTRRVAGLALAG